jgi:hypothetical protein
MLFFDTHFLFPFFIFCFKNFYLWEEAPGGGPSSQREINPFGI